MRLFSVLTILALSAVSIAAHADTYKNFYLNDYQDYTGYGFTSGGNTWVLTNGENLLEYSLPQLQQTPDYFEGAPTAIVDHPDPVLDGGRYPGSFILNQTGGYHPDSQLVVLNTLTGSRHILYTGYFAYALMDSYGDVGFHAYTDVSDSNILAVNETTHAAAAVTPEPSSFALLGTGLLGVVAMIRRRFA